MDISLASHIIWFSCFAIDRPKYKQNAKSTKYCPEFIAFHIKYMCNDAECLSPNTTWPVAHKYAECILPHSPTNIAPFHMINIHTCPASTWNSNLCSLRLSLFLLRSHCTLDGEDTLCVLYCGCDVLRVSAKQTINRAASVFTSFVGGDSFLLNYWCKLLLVCILCRIIILHSTPSIQPQNSKRRRPTAEQSKSQAATEAPPKASLIN